MRVPSWLKKHTFFTYRAKTYLLLRSRLDLDIRKIPEIELWINGEIPHIEGYMVYEDRICDEHGDPMVIKHCGKVFYAWDKFPCKMPIGTVATTAKGISALHDVHINPFKIFNSSKSEELSCSSVLHLMVPDKFKYIASVEKAKDKVVVITKNPLSVMAKTHNFGQYFYSLTKSEFVKQQLIHGSLQIISDGDYKVELPDGGGMMHCDVSIKDVPPAEVAWYLSQLCSDEVVDTISRIKHPPTSSNVIKLKRWFETYERYR